MSRFRGPSWASCKERLREAVASYQAEAKEQGFSAPDLLEYANLILADVNYIVNHDHRGYLPVDASRFIGAAEYRIAGVKDRREMTASIAAAQKKYA